MPICPYRPATRTVIDGTAYFANGWNQPWYMDIGAGKLFPLGSRAPTTFALALSAAGTPAALPTGQSATYNVVFRNNARQEETAPQVAAAGDVTADPTLVLGVPGIAIANASGSTRDVTITWTDPADGRWTTADIYKRRVGAAEFVRVASVAIATATYLDVTPDASLSTLISQRYVTRYRLTLPEKFKVTSAHLGRILAITGKDSVIRYSQPVRGDGELVQTDIPPENLLAIEPDDGLGELVTIFGHYDTTIAVKRYGCYLIEGDVGTAPSVTRMYQGRGALSARSWVAVHSAFVIMDELGLYGWSPNAEPQVLGTAGDGNAASPLAPFWKRVNRGIAAFVHLVHREERGTVEASMPIDSEPIPMRAPVWNYRANRFDSIDDRVSLAAGDLEDSAGVRHECYGGDIGYIRERETVVSDGVEEGTVHATSLIQNGPVGRITSGPSDFSTSTLLGAADSFCERRAAATAPAIGTLLDFNRVLQVDDPDTVRVLYFSPVATALSDTLDVGVIAGVAEFPASDAGTADRKTVQRLIVRFVPQLQFLGVSPVLHVFTAPDVRAYTDRRAIDMTKSDGWALVPCWDRGFRWNLRFEAHRAADRFEVTALTADLWANRVRR